MSAHGAPQDDYDALRQQASSIITESNMAPTPEADYAAHYGKTVFALSLTQNWRSMMVELPFFTSVRLAIES